MKLKNHHQSQISLNTRAAFENLCICLSFRIVDMEVKETKHENERMECVDQNENQDLDNRRFCVSAFGRFEAVKKISCYK